MSDRHFLLDPVENAKLPSISASRRGTAITINIFESSVDEVIDAGFGRIVLERSKDNKLSWQEVTAPDTRPALQKGQFDYTLVDGTGDPDYFYRTRYMNEKTGECTQPSEVIEGRGLSTDTLLTVDELKSRYLFGLDLTDDDGNELSDQVYQHYIIAAIRWFEHELDIPIIPTTFSEAHDYHDNDWHAFNYIQLDNYPLASVEEFRVQYPSGQVVIVYPDEWLRIYPESGQLQVVPTAGTLSQILIGQGGAFLPAIYNGMQTLPQLFEITYVAGFGEGQVPRNITDIIGKFASLGPFNIFGDLIAGAGIATISLSMDGLSQNIGTTSSATNSGYGARIGQYLKEIKDQIPKLRAYYKRPARMVVA